MGNETIEQAEDHHQQLSDGVSLGIEEKGRDADQRGTQGKKVVPAEEEEGQQNQCCRGTPQHLFGFGKVGKKLFHADLQKKKHPHTHLQRPNDAQTNAFCISLPGGRLICIFLYRITKAN